MRMRIIRDEIVPLTGKVYSATGTPYRHWNMPLLKLLAMNAGIHVLALKKNILELLEALDGVEIEVPDGN